jgi:hypothetical protein
MSDLLWYFKRPQTPELQNMRYAEFFGHYYLKTLPLQKSLTPNQFFLDTVNTDRGLQHKVIQKRSRGPIITRLKSIPPRLGELFYAHALLRHRPARGFEDLRTLDGQIHPTFQQAATALGLFRDDNEAVYAMKEAISAYSRPSQLRFLFAFLILDLPTSALELWTTFKNDLCADFAMHHHEPRATSLALKDIALYLSSQGSSLAQHGLPNPTSDTRVTELDQELNAFLSQRVTLLQRSEELRDDE